MEKTFIYTVLFVPCLSVDGINKRVYKEFITGMFMTLVLHTVTSSWEAIISVLVEKFSPFYEPEDSLLCLAKPTTGPGPGTDESITHLPILITSCQMYFNIILPLMPSLPGSFFISGFPIQHSPHSNNQ
jgi:hypothetical protein